MTLGEQIKQAREGKNMSQEDLAARMGVSRQAVSKWENDTSVPQGANREMLSRVLELELQGPEDTSRQKPVFAWLGWIAALVLALAMAGMWLWQGRGVQDGDEAEAGDEVCADAQFRAEEVESVKVLAFIDHFDGQNLAFDTVEWVEVPSQRAEELGVSDEGSGFYIYNVNYTVEELPLAQNCICTVLNWTPEGGGTYTPMNVTTVELTDLMEERAGLSIPYHLTIQDNEIVEIVEQYVP